MFYCPNCGGKMVFDIPTQKMKCAYCESIIPPENYNINNNVNESTYETNVYVCRNCGAELTSPDEQMVSFCSYCGSEAVLAGKLTQENKPKEMIPFRIAKKQCQEIYKAKVGKALFLPKEMKNEQFLDQFRGIYIPFYSIGVEYPGTSRIMASSETHLGGSRYQINTYLLNMMARDEGRYERDGSAALDDTITQAISGYTDKTVGFNPAYLAGFYADRSDVKADQYIQDVQEEAAVNAQKAMQTELGRRQMSYAAKVSSSAMTKAGFAPGTVQIADYSHPFQARCTDFFSKLVPVWFLTWRNKERVSYVVMNGETGNMYTELPVDKKQYLLMAGVISLVLFAVLSLFFTIIAPTMLGITATLSAVNLIVLTKEMHRLRDKELHVYDIGSKDYNPENAKFRKRFKAKPAKAGASIGVFTMLVIAIAYGFAEGGIDWLFSGGISHYAVLTVLALVSGVIAIVCLIKGIGYGASLNEKSMIIWPILNALPLFFAVIVAIWRPVDDWIYYLSAALCMAGAFVPALKLIDLYNLMATRPLPSFFGREGANHGLDD